MSIQQALISVSNKTGLIPFAKALAEMGIHLLSTGGTYKILQEAQIPVEEVSHYTGFQEMMDGRVKTLHPKIHGGILGRRGIDDEVMQQQNIRPIDLVIVNLYPFAETIAKPNCPFEEAVEQIDIGGPTLLRAAAKNHHDVGVIVDPQDYEKIITELTTQKKLSHSTRLILAQKAFQHTAQYDTTIAAYLKTQLTEASVETTFPETFSLTLKKQQDLRYGENPHQQAAFYVETPAPEGTIASAQQLQGKELSFNNITDTDTALECVKSFTQPACVIVKHANPCGVALADNLLAAYDQAYATDPTSAFGGIIAFNKILDEKTAQAILDRQFVEVIIAPNISAEAKKCFAQKPNIRVLISGAWQINENAFHHYQRVHGGLLVQTNDQLLLDEKQLRCVTQRQPTEQEMQDLLFCWTVAKFVKSNAIVYAKNKQTIGIGAGQMSRVYSAKIANIKAQDEKLTVAGSVMASDAFFPFRDGIDAAAEAGITAVIQPGGSIRDEEVIAAANEANMAMLFTGIRHFRH